MIKMKKVHLQIEKIVYRKFNCEDCGKAFENLEIEEKRFIEEYDTENIETYLRRSKLRRLTKVKDEKTETENNCEKETVKEKDYDEELLPKFLGKRFEIIQRFQS